MLRPFFSYYGSKWRAAKYYPKPEHDQIIEPFAGSAGYSVRHFERDVTLVEVDPIVAGVWSYLIRTSSEEILRLPSRVESVDDLQVCQEAKWLIGFWLNRGAAMPRKTPAAWMRSTGSELEFARAYWGDGVKDRLAGQVDSIRHWSVINASYEEMDCRIPATWFIDPPYQNPSGRHYRHGDVDFGRLSSWAMDRPGQVIVCESEGADWLPFQPFRSIQATRGAKRKGTSEEIIYHSCPPNDAIH